MKHKSLFAMSAFASALMAAAASPVYAEDMPHNSGENSHRAAHAVQSMGPVWLIESHTGRTAPAAKIYSLNVAAFSLLASLSPQVTAAYADPEIESGIDTKPCVEAGYLKLSRYRDENKTCAFREARAADSETQHLNEGAAIVNMSAVGGAAIGSGPALGN